MENHQKPLYFDTFSTGAPAEIAGDGICLGFRRVPLKKHKKPLATASFAPMRGPQVPAYSLLALFLTSDFKECRILARA